MKVLWVEDHEPVRDLLLVAADKAARARVPVDLVMATTLMEAENRLRLERFDLVVLDLTLPDSFDGDMTIARVANMGKHRIAVCSAQPERDQCVETALKCGNLELLFASQRFVIDAAPAGVERTSTHLCVIGYRGRRKTKRIREVYSTEVER